MEVKISMDKAEQPTAAFGVSLVGLLGTEVAENLGFSTLSHRIFKVPCMQ